MLISHKTHKITSQFFVITNMATSLPSIGDSHSMSLLLLHCLLNEGLIKMQNCFHIHNILYINPFTHTPLKVRMLTPTQKQCLKPFLQKQSDSPILRNLSCQQFWMHSLLYHISNIAHFIYFNCPFGYYFLLLILCLKSLSLTHS
jgi:hypothetical protein